MSMELKEVLISNNISINELADYVGVYPGTVYGWIKGKCPNVFNMERINQFFKEKGIDYVGWSSLGVGRPSGYKYDIDNKEIVDRYTAVERSIPVKNMCIREGIRYTSISKLLSLIKVEGKNKVLEYLNMINI